MKNIISVYLLAFVSLTSCSTKNETYNDLYGEEQTLIITPENHKNPYDYIGAQYLKLDQEDLQKNGLTNRFNSIQNKSTNSDYTIYSNNTLTNLISASQLTLPARESLLGFTSTVLNLNQESYSILYTYIVNYENEVVDSNIYYTEDKRIILSFASIVRYAAYQNSFIQTQSEGDDDEEEIEDEDWNISVGNMTGWLSDILNDGNTASN